MGDFVKKAADLVTANTIFCTKEVLASAEAAKYMGISLSHLYKLTMRKAIPHYKPMGKMCYFNRAELDAWLQNGGGEVIFDKSGFSINDNDAVVIKVEKVFNGNIAISLKNRGDIIYQGFLDRRSKANKRVEKVIEYLRGELECYLDD